MWIRLAWLDEYWLSAYGLLIFGYRYQQKARSRLQPAIIPIASSGLVLNKTFAAANMNNSIKITINEKKVCKGLSCIGLLELV